MHFFHHMHAMDLDRDFADTDIRRNLFVQKPAATSAITSCSRGVRLSKRFRASQESALPFEPSPVAGDRGCDSIQHVLVSKRLRKEIDGAGFHGPHGHGNIAVSCDEDDGNMDIGLGQLGMKLETAQPG